MSVSEDQSSTHNYSKTTYMDGPYVNYHDIEAMDYEVDPERVKAFNSEIYNSASWPSMAQISTVHDKNTRTQYHIDTSHTKLSFIKNYGSLYIHKFNELEIGDQSMKIEVANPESKGISAYAWRPCLDKDHSSIISLAMFGGSVEHWNTGYKVGVFHDDNNEMYTDIVYSPDGKSVIVGCRSGEVYPDNKIYAIDVESSQKTKLTIKAKHGNRVQALHWGQDGLFSLGWDNVLYRWDINLDHPVLNCFCPCSNKDAACFTGGLLFAGIVHPQDNLQVLDLNSGKILSKSTVKSNQAALNLGSNDFGCEVQILKQVRFDPNLFIVATSHNDTLKIMKLEGQKMTEVYAWESLPSQVFSLETSALRRRIFCGGKQFQTSLDFGSA